MADDTEPTYSALSMQLHEHFALMAKVEREIADRLQRQGFRSPLFQNLATEMEARQALQTGTLIALARAEALEFMAEDQRRHAHNAIAMRVATEKLTQIMPRSFVDLEDRHNAAIEQADAQGFEENHAVGAGRSSVKRSHRAEGRNFID